MKLYKTLIMILSLVFLISCTKVQKENETRTVFKVIKPLVTDTTYIEEHIVNINSIENVDVRAKISGYISTVLVDEGQKVKKGQILFKLNKTQYNQELLSAKARTKLALSELEAAKIELKGSKKLLDSGFISQTQYELELAKIEMLIAKHEESLAEENQARIQLNYTDIYAPFDGIINRIPHRTGSLVDEGTVLTTISNNSKMHAYFSLSEVEYLNFIKINNLEDKQFISLLMADNTEYAHLGQIETSDSEIDVNTGTISFRASFLNPENILKHGATGKVRLKTKLKNAILIPMESTYYQQDLLYVYIVDDSNTIKPRQVKPLIQISNLLVIDEGLTAKDKILFDGTQNVKQGEIVEYKLISHNDWNNKSRDIENENYR